MIKIFRYVGIRSFISLIFIFLFFLVLLFLANILDEKFSYYFFRNGLFGIFFFWLYVCGGFVLIPTLVQFLFFRPVQAYSVIGLTVVLFLFPIFYINSFKLLPFNFKKEVFLDYTIYATGFEEAKIKNIAVGDGRKKVIDSLGAPLDQVELNDGMYFFYSDRPRHANHEKSTYLFYALVFNEKGIVIKKIKQMYGSIEDPYMKYRKK